MNAKNILLGFCLLFLMGSSALSQNSDEVVIRISPDHFNRIYKVFFASNVDYKTRITLNRVNSSANIIDETIIGSGFMKLFSLKDAPNGMYEWVIEYGDEVYTEKFEVKSQSELMKESITAQIDDDYNLTIEVKPYNKNPISLFFYTGSGDQLAYIFWEPKETEFKKVFALGEYDAYEIKVEILQGGDVQFSETFQLY